MRYEMIDLQKKDGIATVTINRPKALNALNSQVLTELMDAVQTLSCDGETGVVILTGSGDKAFIAGADIKEMLGYGTKEGLAFADLGHGVLSAMESSPAVFIAAVNGFALGGGTEVSMGCDIIYASGNAKFGQPEVKLGIIPGFGGTQRLSRIVGLVKARELIFTGDTISAEEAKRIGLVAEVFKPDELMDRVLEKAKTILSNGPLAVAAAKRAMNKGYDLALDSAMELEKQTFSALFGSEDQKEGMKAFTEKRKASFKNS